MPGLGLLLIKCVSRRQEVCRIKPYILVSELKANLCIKLDHSQCKVPLLRLYGSEGPLEVDAYLK